VMSYLRVKLLDLRDRFLLGLIVVIAGLVLGRNNSNFPLQWGLLE